MLALILADRLNIWQDEAYTMHTTSHGFLRGFLDGFTFEVQAPLYFGVLGAWRLFNSTIFFARVPSIVFMLAALWFAARFARRYLPRVPQPFIIAVFALNPFSLWAAVEMRPYAAAIALSFALLYYFFVGWTGERIDWRARWAFLLTAVIGAYTQYYVVTLVAAGFVIVALQLDRRRLLTYVGFSAIIAILLLPITLFLPMQLASYSPLATAAPVPLYYTILPLFEFVFPHQSIGSWSQHRLENLTYLAIVVLPVFLVVRSIAKIQSVTRILIVLSAILTLIFWVLIGVCHVNVIFPRQMAILFPPLVFAGLSFINSAHSQRRVPCLRVFGTVYMLLSVTAIWSNYHGLSKTGDWINVTRFLSAHVTSADAVTVFDAEAALPLSFYYHKSSIVAIPRAQSFASYDQDAFPIRRESDLEKSLGLASLGRQRLWLVRNDVCADAPAFYGCGILDAYVKRHFQTISRTAFNGSSVIELSPNTTTVPEK